MKDKDKKVKRAGAGPEQVLFRSKANECSTTPSDFHIEGEDPGGVSPREREAAEVAYAIYLEKLERGETLAWESWKGMQSECSWDYLEILRVDSLSLPEATLRRLKWPRR